MRAQLEQEVINILHLYSLALKHNKAKDINKAEYFLKLCINKEIDENDIQTLTEYCFTHSEYINSKHSEFTLLRDDKKDYDKYVYCSTKKLNRLCSPDSKNYALELKAHCATKLGGIYYQAHNPYDALICYKKAYDFVPNNTVYLNNFITMLLENKHYYEAEYQLKKCISEADFYFPCQLQEHIWKASCANNLALIYSEGNIRSFYRENKATYYFQMAHELHPTKSDYIYHLAMNYYDTKNFEEAEFALKQCANIVGNQDYVSECNYYLDNFL